MLFRHNSEQAQAYDKYQDGSNITHDLLVKAAAFETSNKLQEHEEKHGKPQSYALAKGVASDFVGEVVDREIENKGLDFIDGEQAKQDAKKEVDEALVKEYKEWYARLAEDRDRETS
jgi:hypothetical protein